VLQNLVHAYRAHHVDRDREPLLIAELAVWSATADGVLDRAELSALAALLRDVPGLSQFTDAAAFELAETLVRKYVTEDAIGARITEIALSIRTPDARRASYQLAVWSAARDGQFSEEEAAFLENLQDCLEIDDDEADQLAREATAG
jgi:tellurite resistance protein